MHLSTDGIILKLRKIDDDRMLTILSGDHGVVTAYAYGANKMRSALASSTELLTFSRFILFGHRGRHTVDRADINRVFFGIRTDVEKLALASFFAELSAELCPHGEAADAYLTLLLNTLHLLEAHRRPLLMLKAVFSLRMLTMAGFMPNLVACRTCGCYEHVDMRFFPSAGELLCGDCGGFGGSSGGGGDGYAGDGAAIGGAGAMPVPPGILTAMRHTIYCDAKKLFAFSLSDESLSRFDKIIEAYLQCQLDKKLATLEFYEGIRFGQS